jgi:2-polyprenyl-3-methyl-5-hydroxy-6-metoxy-1,4-benzoquinol methylase
MGAHDLRKKFIATSVRPFQGMKILDIGCGPADILSYLPDVDYWGFDISEEYIQHAKKKFGSRGNFHCQLLELSDLSELPAFDIVLALGVLHHLDDSSAAFIMRLASEALKPGGRLLTIDPCLEPSQNQIARFLIRRDRGQNVRDKVGYQEIAQTAFDAPKVEVRHKAWIPYTHCFMECQKLPEVISM